MTIKKGADVDRRYMRCEALSSDTKRQEENPCCLRKQMLNDSHTVYASTLLL